MRLFSYHSLLFHIQSIIYTFIFWNLIFVLDKTKIIFGKKKIISSNLLFVSWKTFFNLPISIKNRKKLNQIGMNLISFSGICSYFLVFHHQFRQNEVRFLKNHLRFWKNVCRFVLYDKKWTDDQLLRPRLNMAID